LSFLLYLFGTFISRQVSTFFRILLDIIPASILHTSFLYLHLSPSSYSHHHFTFTVSKPSQVYCSKFLVTDDSLVLIPTIQCAFTPDVCKLVCEWVVCDSARDRCVLCKRDLVAICFIVPGFGCFVSQGVGRLYATSSPGVCPPIPARLHSSPWCIRCLAWCTWLLTPISVSSRHSLQLRRPYS